MNNSNPNICPKMVQNGIAHGENLEFGPNVMTDRHVGLQFFYLCSRVRAHESAKISLKLKIENLNYGFILICAKLGLLNVFTLP